jgi:hypothetical protein
MLAKFPVCFDQRGTGKTKMRIHMNRLRNIVGLIAVCATSAFFTGCGDDDHADNGTPPPNAPASLAGRTYNLADAGGNTVVAFDPNGTAYTLTPSGGGAAETGSFTANQSGDVDTVSLVGNGAATNSTLTLTFTAPGTGTYTFDRPGEALVSGNFSEQGAPTDGTTNGGTTNGGTDGSVQAPATLQTITIKPVNGIQGGSTVNVTLNNGTFTASGTEGQDLGSGTYSYTPSGTTAHLRLDYGGNAAGDYDDYNLVFTQQQGSGQPNNFTGTQKVGGDNPAAINGTFTY